MITQGVHLDLETCDAIAFTNKRRYQNRQPRHSLVIVIMKVGQLLITQNDLASPALLYLQDPAEPRQFFRTRTLLDWPELVFNSYLKMLVFTVQILGSPH